MCSWAFIVGKIVLYDICCAEEVFEPTCDLLTSGLVTC